MSLTLEQAIKNWGYKPGDGVHYLVCKECGYFTGEAVVAMLWELRRSKRWEIPGSNVICLGCHRVFPEDKVNEHLEKVKNKYNGGDFKSE